jgi:precorrin-3B synthase
MTEVRGWCPGAHRPMMSGDGLVVRVRPQLARLTLAQASGLAQAAAWHGAGLIDLTNRANLQIRGVQPDALPALLAGLEGLGLLDVDPELESRRNILHAPDWIDGDDTHRLASELAARLAELPVMPAKVGFAIDAGPRPVLGAASADFRIERGRARGLILRADGRDKGVPLAPGTEIDTLIDMAHWFAATGARRMRSCAQPLPESLLGTVPPAPARAPLQLGEHPLGTVFGLPFGQIAATDLLSALELAQPTALRMTPWRTLMFEGIAPMALPGLILDPEAAALRADACPGAPLCPQSTVETRALARDLVQRVPDLHVSGCAKGCARPGLAAVVLTGRDGAFDLALNARAGDPPHRSGLTPAQVMAHFGA